MAAAFPNSAFTGSDYREGCIATARTRAEEAGAGDRIDFRVAFAAAYLGRGFDLVTVFDCLHDMGGPAAAARHVRETIAPDGTWMIVEPAAGDQVEDNLNPVGRALLRLLDAAVHAVVAVAAGRPGARRPGGRAKIRDVVTAGGFTRFRRAAEAPFNIVYEARP